MNESRKRNIIIASLCGVLLLMAVGYAAFQSVLNIEGTANITSNWNVLITDIQEKEHVGSATSVEEYPKYDNLTATFNVNLVSPGDSISYDVTIENQGSLDAELEKINVTDSENPAIKFETSGIEEGNILEASGNATLTVKITYDSNVTSQPESRTSNLTVTLDYVEKGKTSEWLPDDTETASEMLIKKVTTSGDGLYADTYEDGRYIYKGGNPNNYITFNNEEAGWRIISVENDGAIKIVKNSSIDNRAFDEIGHRNIGFCF